MTREQLDIFLTDLEAQFPGYYPNAHWNVGALTDTINGVNESIYFDLTNSLLHTFTTVWDAGVSVPIVVPKIDLLPYEMWFDTSIDTLYTAIPDWDTGTILPIAQPAEDGTTTPVIGEQWFDESLDTLYTCTTNFTWTGATFEVLYVVILEMPLKGDQWFNENSNTLYTNLENAWNDGVVADTITAVEGSTYFDESNNTLYTFTTVWDAGTVIPITEAGAERPLNEDQWFNEITNILYTYIDEAGWLALEQVAIIMFANNENVYPDRTLQLNFDDTYEIMYIRTGEYNEAGSFINTTVISAVNYSLIVGVELYRKERMKSAYKVGRQV